MVRHRSSTMGRCSVVFASLALTVGGCSGAGPGPGEDIGTTSSAYTFPDDQTAFDYFRSKGLTAVQAAGIVGNLDQESGDDPTSVQYGGGPGRGIAQWSVGGRWDTDPDDNATWYAQTQNEPLSSLQLQLEFVWYELTTFSSYGLASLQQATSVRDATIAFETDFEGCGDCDQSTRIMYGESVLAAFGADPIDASAPPESDGGDGAGAVCTVTTTGDVGTCMTASACAALGHHVSTPGYCPGPEDVECCTPTEPAGSGDASAPEHDDGGAPGHDDAGGSAPSGSADGSTTHAPADGGAHADIPDAAAPGEPGEPGSGSGAGSRSPAGGRDAAGAAGGFGDEPPANGGCTIGAPRGGTDLVGWLPAIAWAFARGRRRRRAKTPTEGRGGCGVRGPGRSEPEPESEVRRPPPGPSPHSALPAPAPQA